MPAVLHTAVAMIAEAVLVGVRFAYEGHQGSEREAGGHESDQKSFSSFHNYSCFVV